MTTDSFTKEFSVSAESLLEKLYKTEMENRKLKKLLKEIEWIYDCDTWEGKELYRCPSCRKFQSNGHSPDCQLAKLLYKEETLAHN